MNGLITILLIGLVVYMLFSKKGGMGCCGGHHDHAPGGQGRQDDKGPDRANTALGADDRVFDLKKEDYKVVSSDTHQVGNQTL